MNVDDAPVVTFGKIRTQYCKKARKHDNIDFALLEQFPRRRFEQCGVLPVLRKINRFNARIFCPLKCECIRLVGNNKRNIAAFYNRTALVEQSLKVRSPSGNEHGSARTAGSFGPAAAAAFADRGGKFSARQHISIPSPSTVSPQM